jgi:hypothetical protein
MRSDARYAIGASICVARELPLDIREELKQLVEEK